MGLFSSASAADSAGPIQGGDVRAERSARIAAFFIELRRYLQLTQRQAAAEIATHPDVIVALENGQLDDLPAWPETQRVVAAYAAMAGIDAGPILNCLKAHTQRPGSPPPSSVDEPPHVSPWARFSPRLPRRLPVKLVMISAAIAAGIGVAGDSRVQKAALGAMPRDVARAVRAGQDAVLIQFARRIDGLAWIDVRDPRSRRSDKLPIRPR